MQKKCYVWRVTPLWLGLPQEVEERLLVAVANGDVEVIVVDDAVAVNLAYFAFLNDVGAVHPDKSRRRQHLFHRLHVHQRQDGVGRLLGVDFHIVLQTLDVTNVVEVDLQQLVLALDKDACGLGCALLFGLLQHLEPLQRFVAGFEKLGVGDGLEQVVESVDALTVNGILVKRGGEHHACGFGQHFRELQPVEFWHLDVEKHQVHWIVGDASHSVDGIRILAIEFHERNFLHIAHQQLYGKGLVVNYCALYYHCRE